MNESIKQVLIMAVAGILFCLAVTVLLLEIKAVSEMGKADAAQNYAVWEKGSGDICGE